MRSIFTLRRLAISFAILLIAAATNLFVPTARTKEPPRKPTSIMIVTNWGEDTCSLIDIDAGKELAKISVGLKPYDVKVDPKGRFAYATASGANYVSVIDLQAMLERKDQRITVGEGPRDLELSDDGNIGVVANSGDDNISVVDMRSKKDLYRVPVGSITYGVDLTNDEKFAVITLWGSNKTVLVELGTTAGRVVKTFNVGSLPYTVVIPQNSDYAVVSCFGSHQLYVIDLNKSEVMPPVNVGRSPWGLSASGDGKTLIVANFYSGDASVLALDVPSILPPPTSSGGSSGRNNFMPSRYAAPATPTVPMVERVRIPLLLTDAVGTTREAARPKNAAFTNDPNVAVLTDLGKNEVIVLDIPTRKITKRVAVGKAPYGVAFVPRNL
jgi:YVTN family beta-propeller protein